MTLTCSNQYSVEGIHNSYGHNERFEQHPHQDYPVQQNYPQEYTLHPEDHHDAYYNQPYEPTGIPHDDYDLANYPQQQSSPYQDDRVPILQADNPYGPNP